MKKHIVITVITGLIVASLSACGKDAQQDETLIKIEANNAAESREPTQRKYEEATKESVVAPDRNGTTTSNTDEQLFEEIDTSEVDISIYGNWFEDDGSAFSIYKENEEIMFSGYDAETDRGLFGTIQSDEETYIEFKQNKEISEEPIEEEVPIQEDINIDELGDGYSYDPEKGLQQEVNVIDQYGSEEEFNRVMEEENKKISEGTLYEDKYEIIRYNIDSIDIDTQSKQVIMAISNESKTYILRKNI